MIRKSLGDRKRYEVLGRMLRDRQGDIQSKLRLLREVLPSEVIEVKDAEEQSVEDFVRGMDFALMEMESETLRKIDQAMQRLDRGTYGICADCGEKIAEPRLKALPFALLCRGCQETQEERRSMETARPAIPDEVFPSSPRDKVAKRGPQKGRRWANSPAQTA